MKEQPEFNEYDFRARERNFHLSSFEKYFGSEKVDGKDLAFKDAVEFNKKVDQLIAEGKISSYTEASDYLVAEEEKNRKYDQKHEIFWEELARAASLRFSDLIDKNKFEEACHTYKILDRYKISPGEKELAKEAVGNLSKDHLEMGTELKNILPTLYEFQREILNEKIKELESANKKEEVEKIKTIFRSVLNETVDPSSPQ
jgi:hypothetical protein